MASMSSTSELRHAEPGVACRKPTRLPQTTRAVRPGGEMRGAQSVF